jgi:glycosyltransferase involved in cell wall biosynthesis
LPKGAKSNQRFRGYFSDINVSNFELRDIDWPRLWTQGGLALECLVNPPDVLFVPAHTLPIFRRFNLKTVVTIHDLGAEFLPNFHKFPQRYYLNTMTEYALKNATRIIAVSEYTKRDIVSKFRASPSKIAVIYEGYDREAFYPRTKPEIDSIKSKLEISGEYLLFVGTIQPRKNLVRLVEAFSQVLAGESLNTNHYSLILAGAPGWLNDEIYQAPAKFGVEGTVRFIGQVSQDSLPALISGSKCFIFPSLFEGFGLAPLEAMACGVPVIMSNVTSLPEVGGEAALYADPNSSSDIASKMELVLSMTDSDRAAVVKKVLNQAQNFSWEKAALETINVLEEAVASHYG